MDEQLENIMHPSKCYLLNEIKHLTCVQETMPVVIFHFLR